MPKDNDYIPEPSDADAFLKRGIERLNDQDVEGACDDLNTALRLNPELAEAFVYRGIARFNNVKYDQALSDFDEAVRIAPKDAWAHKWRGTALWRLDRIDEAVISFTEAIQLQPGDDNAYYNRGVLYFEKGDAEAAIADLTESIRLAPMVANVYIIRAQAFFRLSQYESAVSDYSEVIRLEPETDVAFQLRGHAHLWNRNYDNAIADYSEAVHRNPNDANSFVNRGYIHFQLDNEAEAFADVNEAIRLNPTNSNAFLQRGRILESDEEIDLALADFTEAIRLKPNDAEAYCERGELWTELEQHERAIADFTEAIRLDPDNKQALKGRGGVFDSLGEFTTADADFQRAEDLESEEEEIMPAQKTNVFSILQNHFQPSPLDNLTITERRFPARVRADLQRGIDALVAKMTVHNFCGVHKQHSHHGINFTELVVRDRHDPAVSVPPQYEEFDIGEEQPIRCLKAGLWLLDDAGTRFALFLEPESFYPGRSGIRLQLATANDEAGSRLAQQFFRHLERSVHDARSYRGKILSLEKQDNYSGTSTGIRVHKLRTVQQDQVILPRQTLELLERNVVNFVRERPRLSKIGMATKKGLLFYGPPGSGKTHTLHYLAGALEGMTTLLISAEQVGLLGEYMTLARLLQPSMVVIEDADLIARDRASMESVCEEVLLNKLLNEMDGLREDADILFILTTNRPEAIEVALSSRPGRIDQAIEFPFPDEEGRSKLVRLYSRGDDVPDEVVQETVKKTDNVSAAFIKELMRRAAQFQLERDGSSPMAIADVDNALEEMLFKGGSLNRKLLGGKVDE